ncbi:MAG: SBBP repeat-containing protein [Gammaproteobacteria bacterium]
MKKALILTASLVLMAWPLGVSAINDGGKAKDGLLSYFEPNLGQLSADYTHVVRADRYSALLNADRARFLIGAAAGQNAAVDGEPLESQRVTATVATAVQMRLVGANATDPGTADGLLDGHSNYLFGTDAKRWLSNVPHYSRLQFAEVYPGIDVIYTLEGSALRYDFVLAPRADANDIRLRFDGAEGVELDQRGDLVVRVGGVEMIHSAPKLFQNVDGAQQDVAGGFAVQEDGSLQFRVAEHDADTALVIDPQVTLSTYLGGSGPDRVQDIAVDASGRMVVTGSTGSLDFPIATPIGSTPSGGTDIFVARFAPDGQSLEFATYVGGTGADNPHQVAIDAAGNILLAGYTSSPDFPTMNAVQPGFLGGGLVDSDAFVAKLDPTGASLVYSTYLGGTGPVDPFFGFEWIRGLTVDAAGNAFVVGETSSFDFPATDSVGGRACLEGEAGAVSVLIGDAFVAKFSPSGALEFAACVGGSERDTGRGIDLAVDGAIHIVGFTRSSDYPVSAGAFQTTLAEPGSGLYDVHVTRLDPSGVNIDWASLVGGTDNEFAQQLRVTADSSSVVIGSSSSDDFPTSAGAYQPNRAAIAADGISDSIVFRLGAGGSTLSFGTYLGGTGQEFGWGLDLDENERIYVSSTTESLDFPLVVPTQSVRGGPLSVLGRIGPDTDDTRDMAGGQVTINGEVRRVLVAANAGQSRVYELDDRNVVQSVSDIGAPGDDTVAVVGYDSDFDLLVDAFVLINQAAPSRAYFTDGLGGLLPPVDLTLPGSTATAVATGRLVGLLEDDIVIGGNLSASVVYPGNGSGFDPGLQILPGSENTATLSLAVGDLNLDGFGDVVEGNAGRNLIYFGTGNGFLASVELGTESAESTSIAIADVDMDGDPDVVVGNDGAPNRLYRNLGDGTFAFLQDLDGNVATTQDLILTNLNGDGSSDIVTADNGVGVAYVNDGTGQFTALPLGTELAPATAIFDTGAFGVFRATDGEAIEWLDLSTADAYLSVLDPSGRELLFSTYVGGSGSDRSEWGLFVQDSANIYLAGSTAAPDFPTVTPFQSARSGSDDAFITRFALDDLTNPGPAAIYETVLDLTEPAIDGITQVVFTWSTLGCAESSAEDLYDYEMRLVANGEVIYADSVIRDGILQPFRGLQRANPTWDFDLATMTLRQFNTGIDTLVGVSEAFGTNYLVSDADSLPSDGVVSISRFDDGVFVSNADGELAAQSTLLVAGDCDGDGVDALEDNCLNVANADQRDTNGDNIGNACDADLNDDCTVNVIDLGILRNVFFSSDADADFNGDGVVNVGDLGILRSGFFGTPGPSGIGNACQ